MRMRPERSGRDGPGPAIRGASSVSRGRSSFNDRDGGRPMVMNDQVSFSIHVGSVFYSVIAKTIFGVSQQLKLTFDSFNLRIIKDNHNIA